ncbi:hypothetical protein MYAM1_003161 [Malassezia yamatoensis]|uniref:Major facilitator superfamily (MFS) profile domain-containing protein n=1 Tax=Malassezia yamatoensis TaxID=253288 RepID=A0AAJ5YVA3_9BASI|nr:hypothetical protein MYAM1_003161 [Malassezia yamatoensis]
MSLQYEWGTKLEEGGSPISSTFAENKESCGDLVPNGNDVVEDPAEEARPYLVTWDESDEHENPRNWPRKYRKFLVFIVSLYALLAPINSTMNAPALTTLQQEFHVTSDTVTNMMMSASMLAYVIAPMIYGPLCERVGRKYVLQVSNFIFLIFNVGCGLSQNTVQMIVLRFFTGYAGCAPNAIGAGIIVDLFGPEERGSAMAMYTLAPVLGPCIGPIFAGWIIQGYGEEHWRWIFWISTMFGALVSFVGLFVVKETYEPVLLERKAKRLRKETGNNAWHTKYTVKETLASKIAHGIMRPCIFIVTQPVITVTCIYQALLFGCQYLLLASFSKVFRDEYHQPVGIASLHYIAMALGFTTSGQVGGRLVDYIYRRLKVRNNGVGHPEYKLPLLVVTGLLMPAGLLLYGWTVEYHVHWIVPDIGIFMIASGVRMTLFICPLYLADAITLYTASATSALVMTRGLFSFTFPLFAPQLYAKLGQGWGNSVLALAAACIGLPAPFIMYKAGQALRNKSDYSQRAMKLMS